MLNEESVPSKKTPKPDNPTNQDIVNNVSHDVTEPRNSRIVRRGAMKSEPRPKRTSIDAEKRASGSAARRASSTGCFSKKRKLSTDSAEMRKKPSSSKANRLGLIGFEEVFGVSVGVGVPIYGDL